MGVCSASNHVDKFYNPTRAAAINDLFRFQPVTRYRFIKARYSMAVNLLHSVAQQPQAEASLRQLLDFQKSLHYWGVGILTFVDQYNWVTVYENIQQRAFRNECRS
ncbi:hypothetical protein EMIT0232MI5_30156 [Pseudomonas sp. IT-232MI5]